MIHNADDHILDRECNDTYELDYLLNPFEQQPFK